MSVERSCAQLRSSEHLADAQPVEPVFVHDGKCSLQDCLPDLRIRFELGAAPVDGFHVGEPDPPSLKSRHRRCPDIH